MKRIGLVLSGGMGKGAYQIGALRAIEELFQPSQFEYVSAASVGALNAYAFLTGNLDAAQSMWENANKENDRRFITSVLKSTFLQDCIRNIATDVQIPTTYYVPLLDMENRSLDYYELSHIPYGHITDYLSASVAMPLYNKGVEIDGKTLFDGAVVDNIPVYPVCKNDLDIIICIYFDDVHYIFEDYDIDHKILRLTFPDKTTISHSVYITHEAILSMIDVGYKRTNEVLSYVFAGSDELDDIYEKICHINQANQQTKMRITGDVVVTNMNTVFQKLLKSKNIIERGKCHEINS